MRTGLTFARDFAIAAHAGQRYGHRPYTVHLDAVAEIVLFIVDHPDSYHVSPYNPARMAAFLHDVLEDTPVTPELLAATFAEYPDVVRIVNFCTDEPGSSRRVRKQRTYARMRDTIDEMLLKGPTGFWIYHAVQVKLADRIANLRACRDSNDTMLAMYRNEDAEFRTALAGTLGSEKLWAEYDRLIIRKTL